MMNYMPECKTSQRIQEVTEISEILRSTYEKFGIDVEVDEVEYGPRTGLFHYILSDSKDTEKILKLTMNIENALGRHPLTITISKTQKNSFEAVIPFSGAEMFPEWAKAVSQSGLPFSVPLGIEASGEQLELNIEMAQHILIAGSTGTGKSTVIHSIICSLIRKHTSEALKFALMDPKRVELTLYNNLPHLTMPVIFDSKSAAQTFTQLKEEMDQRLKMNSQELMSLPKIVVVVDEFSDFICSECAESIEENVLALTEKGHTVAIHLILSTTRPSINIFTDNIRSAFPSRIVGTLSSSVDSITMLEIPGGERLLGKGDMLLRIPEQEGLIRFQAFQIRENDVKGVVAHQH